MPAERNFVFLNKDGIHISLIIIVFQVIFNCFINESYFTRGSNGIIEEQRRQ